MNKRVIIWAIVIVILAILIIILNILANYKLKKTYTDYYNRACQQQGIGNPFGEEQLKDKALLCSETGGCFYTCGSACPPKQKLSIFRTFSFFKSKSCAEVCVPQCVCKYRYEFEEEKGCI